ncbi:MAG: carbohydrate kinase [Bacteroidales bacterium]|nr:carbohydrate kinase [Bacteroidales bacterium]MCF8458851.1 carbohydrate kinase [Bacteroidales bacterium]
MYLLGLDIGSSSVKAALIDADNGRCLEQAQAPRGDMKIDAPHIGWAEQDPDCWWQNVLRAAREVIHDSGLDPGRIKTIGISYQMHGLVLINKKKELLRPSILWCDSRAAEIGKTAFNDLGPKFCLEHLLNSPGNFTASKLKWVKDNEPDIYEQIYKVLLPGDYIAMKLTGEVQTTASGLSEAILWDFEENKIASFLLKQYGLDPALIPEIVPTFGIQGVLNQEAAEELGLLEGTPVSYRAGDQPNNAFSLNVLNPGEMAATAGTSGVVYGVSDTLKFDPLSRVNTFMHVNNKPATPRLGVLLCVNGTGILNSWLKNNVANDNFYYDDINKLTSSIPIGSDGLVVLPFGNGAERMFQDKEIHSHISGLEFNVHTRSHIFRAAHEGIAFALNFGMNIMTSMGMNTSLIRAAKANIFLSPIFRETLAGISGATIELFNTDGAQGAARAAGLGAGIYHNEEEAFTGLVKSEIIRPDHKRIQEYQDAYEKWKNELIVHLAKYRF